SASAYAAVVWNGVMLVLIPGLLAAFLLDPVQLEEKLKRILAPLTALRPTLYALCTGALATALASLVAVVIMRGLPTLIDSFAQLLHARYFAAGKLAGPVTPEFQQFWHIQQTIVTKNGWVSQYPPGYVALLAIGLRLHFVMLIGPLLYGVAVYFTTRIAEELSPSLLLARIAGLLAAVSPFMLGLSGAYMSHVPAAAFSAGALYFVIKRKPVAAGLFIGMLFAVRPLTGVVAGLVSIVYAVLTSDRKFRDIGFAFAGALPLLALVAWYNAHFFGSPTRFGYDVALGPNAGLGFGIDPWGNRYGVSEALAYTSAELSSLSLFLLEIPLPLLAFVGIYFAQSPNRPSAQSLTFSWVAALVIANMFYWHHGLFMGPRMLADNGPLWVVLAVIATAGLISSIRSDWLIAGKYSVRCFATGSVIAAALAGVLVFAPQRLLSYTLPSDVETLLRAPKTSTPTLMFVHGGWTSRIAMSLAGHGMRLDSVETALRQNSTCAVHHFAQDYAATKQSAIKLDFNASAERAMRSTEVSPGNRVRVAQGEQIDAACAAEIASDSASVVDVTPYIWQGDLPGLGTGGALWVRDMGAAADSALAHQMRERKVASWGMR
ncbi:MAG TPA: hypothetical protein VM100_06810, partial [Longimicrobiales bacterium]|nr:hypothetical protein [Longimicrobiales bacterium]